MVFVGWEVHGDNQRVVPFVMGVNNLGSVGKKWNFVHQLITANAVLAHDSVSFGVRAAGAFGESPSSLRHGRLRHEQSGLYARQAHGTGDANCEHRHSLRMSFDLVGLEAKRFA
jgi:hypothetical protein